MANHSEVAHAWAHQTGKHRNGFRMFYDGVSIYSHGRHFKIAELREAKGRTIVLFSERKYSLSTSKHQGLAAHAVSHLETIKVGSLDNGFNEAREFAYSIGQASAAVFKAKRARLDHNKEWHLRSAQGWCANANRISELFDLGAAPVTLETLGTHVEDLGALLARAEAAERQRNEDAARKRYEDQIQKRNAWLAGIDFWYGTTPEGFALLRVKGDKLETSQGASVPLAHAVKAFKFIKECRDKGEGWEPHGHSLRVGDFTVDRIAPSGDFKAGCHRIAWSEVERIAGQLGMLQVEAA